jgi:hypothetical protein
MGEASPRLGGAAASPTRFVLGVFAASRAAIWATIVLVWLVSESYGNPLDHSDPRSHDLGYVLDALARWDTGWLLGIADQGYSFAPHAYAFFPLYPLLVSVLGRILLDNFLLAAAVVSLAACGASFLLLYRLTRALVGEAAAERAVVYLAVFPTSLFLGVAYTESLYLMLTLLAFLFAERGRWLGAGVASALAVLTRSSGVALLIALPVLAWRRPDRSKALLQLGVALPIGALYPLYLWIRTGDPFVFMTAQHEGWGRRVGTLGPLTGIGRGLAAGFQGVRQLIAGPEATHRYWNWSTDTTVPRAAALSVLFALSLIVFSWLAVVAWRRLGAAYGLFSVISLLIPLSAPTMRWPLLSLPRFGLTIFPLFIALALIGARRTAHTAIVWTSAALAVVVITQWATFYFVS